MQATHSLSRAMKCLALAALAAHTAAHVQMLSPMPRNAIDRDLPQWAGGRFGNGTCERAKTKHTCWGGDCHNGTQPCDVGQNFLWFSQGCSIGCTECDGLNGNPNYRDRCGSGMKPTNNDPRFRGLDRGVPAMSAQDKYQWNPWRAPGSAPVFDPCGAAGGGPNRVETAAPYVDTPFARQGDLGTKVLPKHPTGVVWRSGGRAEVKLSVRANHAGGYQYRLCPAGQPLTEACFQRMPLDFTQRSWLEFRNSSRLELRGTYLSTGTTPAYSTWAMIPLPFGTRPSLGSFAPPCQGIDTDCPANSTWANSTHTVPHPLCEGVFPFGVNVVDELEVPRVSPGEYVLGLRYDAENTAQVWQQCADIVISH